MGFGPRQIWQIFCHPDGRCFNQPQGGPPGVFLRYLGPHERVPAYATIEQFKDGEWHVPENKSLRAEALAVLGANFATVKTLPEWDDLLRNGMNPALIQDAMQAVADASIFAGRASVKL